jgi:hypothetical protein
LCNVALLAANDAGDMIGPNVQCVFYVASVGAAIVDAGDTGLVAALVVQNLLNDVRLNAESAMRVATVRRRSWERQGAIWQQASKTVFTL